MGIGRRGGVLRWRQIPKRDESGMKETGVTEIKPQSCTVCEQRWFHLERHKQNVREVGGGKLTGGTQQAKPGERRSG